MMLQQQSDHLADYLEETEFIDYSSPLIKQKAAQLFDGSDTEIERIRLGYEFVRDKIHHSADINGRLVTRTASKVLLHNQGMCYAKTMLLAALLRSRGVRVGFCYQSLAKQDTPDSRHVIHALNAVYISELKKWVRIDPRGNVSGRNAQFYPGSPLREQLAYPVRSEFGEIDYSVVYVRHPECVMRPLLLCEDCQDMMAHHLPERLD